MQEKLLALVFYAALGIMLAVWPLFAQPTAKSPNASRSLNWLAATVGLFAAAYAVIKLPWWLHAPEPPLLSQFSVVLSIAIFCIVALFLNRATPNNKFRFNAPYLLFLLLAAYASFSTGIISEPNAFLTAWHHWGAYVGPAELLLSGAAIFRDFPAQYGLGPTGLIALFCSSNCWDSAFYVASFCTFIFSAMVGFCSLILSQSTGAKRAVVLLVTLATCFLWTAFPPSVSQPIMTPSVGGLRFLPVMALITYLMIFPNIELNARKTTIAHLLWGIGVLWSPESAFYVTFVWWPFFLFVRRSTGNLNNKLIKSAKSMGLLLLLAGGLIICFSLVYRIKYGHLASLQSYIAYVLYPPGPLPINYKGAIWFFIVTLALSLATQIKLWRGSQDSIQFRQGFLVCLAGYAVFSYFLGRSHDNNLLNIMPILGVMLIHSLRWPATQPFSVITTMLLASTIACLPFFGWQAWQTAALESRLFQFNSHQLTEEMTYLNRTTSNEIKEKFIRVSLKVGDPEDVARAISHIRSNFSEGLTILDYSQNLDASAPRLVWSAVHGPANFFYIPSQLRRKFLLHTSVKLKQTGWLIIDRAFSTQELIDDFETAYVRTQTLDFGTYYAIRLSPKP
jgi:hypothetical protein